MLRITLNVFQFNWGSTTATGGQTTATGGQTTALGDDLERATHIIFLLIVPFLILIVHLFIYSTGFLHKSGRK